MSRIRKLLEGWWIMKEITIQQYSPRFSTHIDKLRGADPVARVHAREQLVKIGRAATEPLVELLQSPSEHVRWEAAKTLSEIADPMAAPALIEAMDDRNTDVRWVAAEALVALGHPALEPLLRALLKKSESIQFCCSAHHVISALTSEPREPELVEVLEALTHEEPAVWVPGAAANALQHLRRAREKVGTSTRSTK